MKATFGGFLNSKLLASKLQLKVVYKNPAIIPWQNAAK